jgi:hypothetical protein
LGTSDDARGSDDAAGSDDADADGAGSATSLAVASMIDAPGSGEAVS